MSESERIVSKAKETLDVTTSEGKVLTLRKPGLLAQYDLIDAIGDKSAKNETFMQMATPMLYVKAIDGDNVPPITSRSVFNSMVKRVGEDGLQAIADNLEKLLGSENPAEKAKK